MKLPSILLQEEKSVFETRLERFIRTNFLTLELEIVSDHAADRYRLKSNGEVMVEIDILAMRDELEIQTAIIDPNVNMIGVQFCNSFYGYIERTYKIQMSSIWVALYPVRIATQTLANQAPSSPEEEEIRHWLLNLNREMLPKIPDFVENASLEECIDNCIRFIQGEKRMTFWQYDKTSKKHKWISHPERGAKDLLSTFLNAWFRRGFYTFEEIVSGAGKVDIFVISPNGEKAVIELKMCGHRYSAKYAQDGLKQLEHYMKNKETEVGYLIVFDSRTRDFSKGFQSIQIIDGMSLVTKIVDVRPTVRAS